MEQRLSLVALAVRDLPRAAVLAEAEAAGAEILRPAAAAAWGGWFGCSRDPEGHLWEVAWNPGFPLDAAGGLTIPD